MPSDRSRSFTSGGGSAATIAAPAGLPNTGTAPGQYRGQGFGQRFGETERTDNWWLQPVAQALGLAILIGYANYAAFLGAAHYRFIEGGRDYLSPFFSPYLKPAWLPTWFSPALLVLIIPLGFRATCYYYRKAYYRVFFADPIACAVGEVRSKAYCGEVKFPFILQNIHRYYLYAAIVILGFLWWDVIRAFTVHGAFAVGGGSIAILLSTVSLTFYTFSCHSLRHLIGGRLDCFSCVAAGGPRHKAWSWVSALNGHHMGFAWWSLLFVCLADLYVRLCSMGVLQDPVFTFASLFNTSPTGL
jgi:hypothetical protein